MRQFRFRLACFERLLAHREDQAKLRAATAGAGRRRAIDVLDHIQRLVDIARGEHRRRRSEPGFDPHEEVTYRSYFDGMTRAIARQQEEVARATAAHDVCQRELREAATRRRALATLRERRFQEHRQESLRELTRLLDDVGGRRARHADSTPGPETAA